MAHFAELNEENKVLRIVVVNNNEIIENNVESEQKGIQFCKSLFGENTIWKQTSYNATFNGKFAEIGDFFNGNVFVNPSEPEPTKEQLLAQLQELQTKIQSLT